jgi:hypothetical protein
VKHPDAVLLCKWAGPTNRAERDLFPSALHFQCVTRRQMELLSEQLWNYDATCFVDGEADAHYGMTLWVKPSVNAI